MGRIAASLAPFWLSLAIASLGSPLSQANSEDETKKTTVAAKDFKETIKAKVGDTLDLQLPVPMSYVWVCDQEPSVLERVKLNRDQIRQIEADQQSENNADQQPENNEAPTVGTPGSFAGRYKVKSSSDKPHVVKWVLSRERTWEATQKRLKSLGINSPPAFSPNMKAEDLSEGMVYQVTLQAPPR